MKRRFSILLCSLLIISLLLIGCGNDDISFNSSESISNASEEVSTDEKNVLYSDLAKKDLQGRVFNIIERRFGYRDKNIDFSGEVLYMEDGNGSLDTFNQTKKDIIEQIQKDYNCTIKGEIYAEGGDDIVANLKELIIADAQAKTGKYDFFFESPYYYFTLTEKGYLKSINDISTINTESSCWNESAIRDFSINGKLYFINGDINTYDNSGSIVLLFNKDLYDSLGYTEDLYTLVRSKQWTFDKMISLASEFEVIDFNKDGTINEYDTWFLGTETSNIYTHVIASGNTMCVKNENDIPEISTTEAFTSSFLKAYEFITESKKVLVADTTENLKKYPSPGEVYEKTVMNAFWEGRELFYATTLIKVPYYRQSNVNFGIVPFPMHSSSQGQYYSAESVHASSALMIPDTPTADDDLGIIIQALCELSEEKLTPVYYDKLLGQQSNRDDDSSEMLDIIFESKKYDLGQIMGFEFPYASFANKNNPLYCGPTVGSIIDGYQKILDNYIESISK